MQMMAIIVILSLLLCYDYYLTVNYTGPEEQERIVAYDSKLCAVFSHLCALVCVCARICIMTNDDVIPSKSEMLVPRF